MPKTTVLVHDELINQIRSMLIAAGTTGVKQTTFVDRLRGYATAAYITHELEVFLAEDKVQKFIVRSRGVPGTIWRATEKMVESELKKEATPKSSRSRSRTKKASRADGGPRT